MKSIFLIFYWIHSIYSHCQSQWDLHYIVTVHKIISANIFTTPWHLIRAYVRTYSSSTASSIAGIDLVDR